MELESREFFLQTTGGETSNPSQSDTLQVESPILVNNKFDYIYV